MRGSKVKRLRKEPNGPLNPGRKSGGNVGLERGALAVKLRLKELQATRAENDKKYKVIRAENTAKIIEGRKNGMSDGS